MRPGRRTVLLGLAALAPACSGPALLSAATSPDGIDEQRGIRYGAHPRQILDLYLPAGAPAGPVVMFLHGGAWRTGRTDMYPFLGRALAREGFRTAVAGYRLSPEVTFPAFVEDAAAALAFLRAALARGGPVFVMGHSAGAQIGALLTLDARYLARQGLEPCSAVAGFIGVSGPYDFLPMWRSLEPIFPPETRAESQPIAFAAGRHPPALLLHGDEDRVVRPENSRRLARALAEAGNRVELRLYPGIGHLDILGAVAPLLGGLAPTRRDIAAFVRAEAARGLPACA